MKFRIFRFSSGICIGIIITRDGHRYDTPRCKTVREVRSYFTRMTSLLAL